jgi:sigma-B regulation protein RsbU (phosphoserine phosphatase)
MSIIDGLPTSAYVIATQQSTVIAVHGNIFWSKIATNPTVVRNLSRVLAERMRKRNDATLRALEKEIRLEQLQRELLAAFEIQNGMLPQGPALLPELPNIDIHARMDVVKSVGGDFYDAFRLDDRRVCIAIGDVSGKGIPAALFMVRTVTLLRAELVKTGTLAECVNRFNSALCDTSLSHMFVSLVVMRIDLIDGAIEYVNAGHPPMLVSHGGDPYIPVDDSQGLIAGVLADNIYHGARTHLNSGDRIVLYTDGVTEARNTSRGFYGQQRLIDFLSARDNRDSAGEVSRIFDDIQSFSDKALQSDDITVIAVTYGGG